MYKAKLRHHSCHSFTNTYIVLVIVASLRLKHLPCLSTTIWFYFEIRKPTATYTSVMLSSIAEPLSPPPLPAGFTTENWELWLLEFSRLLLPRLPQLDALMEMKWRFETLPSGVSRL
jgi:hypothetical protein